MEHTPHLTNQPGDTAALTEVRVRLANLTGAGEEAVSQLDLLEQLRALKAACAAAEARVAVTFATDRVTEAQERGASLRAQRRSAVAELALAHRCAPASMSRRLSQWRMQVRALPKVHALLSDGQISEHHASVITGMAHHLTDDQLAGLDDELAPRLAGMTVRQAEQAARRYCQSVDEETEKRRIAAAAREAHVSIRAVSLELARLSITAPTAEAIAMYAALRAAGAASRRPDETRGQAEVREAFTRITGYVDIVEIPIELHLVITDTTLFGDTQRYTDPQDPVDPTVDDPVDGGADATEPSESAMSDEDDADSMTVADLGAPWRHEPGPEPEPGPQPARLQAPDGSGACWVPASLARGLALGIAIPPAFPFIEPDTARDSEHPRPAYPEAPAESAATGTSPPPPPNGWYTHPGHTGSDAATRDTSEIGRQRRARSSGTPAAPPPTPHVPPGTPAAPPPKPHVPPGTAAASRQDDEREIRRYIRRIFTDPATGTVTNIDTKRRLFTAAQRRFVIARDQVCTTPWCDAPIRDIDHATPYRTVRRTDIRNANGRCQRCNLAKEGPGWKVRTIRPRPGTIPGVVISTPSGKTYTHHAPPVLRPVARG